MRGTILLGVALALAACGGEGAPAAGGTGGAPPPGEVPRLAATGQQLFQDKGCVGCHTIGGGRQSGPDLAGVTERRTYPWIVSMVTHPDSMTRDDPTARQLLGEYLTQMPNLGVTPTEARALWAHLHAAGGA